MAYDLPAYGDHPDYPRCLARLETARKGLEVAIDADGWQVPRSGRILLAAREFDNAWAAVLQLDEQALLQLRTHAQE